MTLVAAGGLGAGIATLRRENNDIPIEPKPNSSDVLEHPRMEVGDHFFGGVVEEVAPRDDDE